MHLRVKPLSSLEKIVEVDDNAHVSDLLAIVSREFGVHPECQRLVHNGCPLLDKNKLLLSYEIKDGDKLTLLTKSTTQCKDFETLLRKYLSEKFEDMNQELVLQKFMQTLYNRISSMSLQDIERLAAIWPQSG